MNTAIQIQETLLFKFEIKTAVFPSQKHFSHLSKFSMALNFLLVLLTVTTAVSAVDSCPNSNITAADREGILINIHEISNVKSFQVS